MISVVHLLWIVPVAGAVGAFLGLLLAGANR